MCECRTICFLHDLWAWHPPVGVWIGVLGLLGVLMPLIRDVGKIGRREKAVWTFVMFVLLGFEIKSVYQDRNEHDKQQREATKRSEQNFREIAQGMDRTMEKSDRNFSQTMAGVDASIKTSTGGDSFCFVTFVVRGSNAELVVLHHGIFPLADVAARIFNSDTFNHNVEISPTSIGTLPVKGSRSIGHVLMPDVAEQKYVAAFTARNGAWDQFILLRRDSKGWHFATRIQENIGQVWFAELNKPRKVIYEKIDLGFPGTRPTRKVWDSFYGIQTFCLNCN